jgi:hypothetical protein
VPINLDVEKTSPEVSHIEVITASQAICCVVTATKRRHFAIRAGVIMNET